MQHDVSVACLIYRGPRWATAVWESAHATSELLRSGTARMFFVANDATPEVLTHLRTQGYPHVVQRNRIRSDAELFAMGYATPEYLHRVYRGWNRAIMESDERCVLVSSDHLFAPGWLEGLVRHYDPLRILASKTVEPGAAIVEAQQTTLPAALVENFGSVARGYDSEGFAAFVAARQSDGMEPGGAHQPIICSRRAAILAGLYPEGNLAWRETEWTSLQQVRAYGDQDFFGRMAARGIQHWTTFSSWAYHVGEGEMREDAYHHAMEKEEREREMTDVES